MAKKKGAEYISGKESRAITKENRRVTDVIEKKRNRKHIPETEYISKMIKEILRENDKKIVASKFINTVVNIILDISDLHKDLPIVLSGGVFQNRTLVEILLKKFKNYNRKVYLGEKYSPNDESISLGQVYFQLKN